MSTYEALALMIAFAALVLILNTNKSDDSTIAPIAFFQKNASLGFICFLIGVSY